MINITEAIYKLYPSVVRTIGDIAYDANGNEVLYDLTAAQAYVSSQAYKDQRAVAYPPMTDYLDGVVKGDAVQVQAYVDACLAVKARYPKP